MNYHWPGNIRELQNVIERAAILARDKVVPIAPHLVTQASAPADAIGNGGDQDEARAGRSTTTSRWRKTRPRTSGDVLEHTAGPSPARGRGRDPRPARQHAALADEKTRRPALTIDCGQNAADRAAGPVCEGDARIKNPLQSRLTDMTQRIPFKMLVSAARRRHRGLQAGSGSPPTPPPGSAS